VQAIPFLGRSEPDRASQGAGIVLAASRRWWRAGWRCGEKDPAAGRNFQLKLESGQRRRGFQKGRVKETELHTSVDLELKASKVQNHAIFKKFVEI
jgi:hypothetical protein